MLQYRKRPSSRMSLHTLSNEVLKFIIIELSISSKLCLRYTCSAFLLAPCVPHPKAILDFDEFVANPRVVRKERALLLAYLESDGFQLFQTNSRSGWLLRSLSSCRAREPLLNCSACGKAHVRDAFTVSQLHNSPFDRRCKGSMKQVVLCPHLSLTWDTFCEYFVDSERTRTQSLEKRYNQATASLELQGFWSEARVCGCFDGAVAGENFDFAR